ncbi:MAG TPA: hypothetical protein VFV34_13260 [Blastocatellia bacterium]|nr:hypothetical protein [Blastocatellia bacterium]
MSEIATNLTLAQRNRTRGFALPFGLSFLSFCLAAALLISWKPLQLSIATIFLFAGPHNWIEFRYFLARMPARWGRSRLFYTAGLGGVAVLTAAYIALYALGQSWYLNEDAWTTSIGAWNSVLVLWVCSLVYLRGREVRRDRFWIFAAGFAISSAVWFSPSLFSLALVYLHPLVALWFLDRQLKRSRPDWRKTYHLCLAVLPVILALMWTVLARASNFPEDDALSWRIAQHAGAGILTGVSTHLLVATHVFLETVHYAAWLVLIPLVGLRGRLWETGRIPLATQRLGWPRTVRTVLILGVFVVIVLWAGFTMNYTSARDVYFTFAMAHVLAEAPFLVRLL